MTYLHAFVEQQRFGAALFTAQGYLTGIDAADGELLDIHEQLVAIATSGRRFLPAFRTLLNAIELPADDQRALLASAEAYRASLADVLSHRPGIVASRPDAAAFWPEALSGEMEDVLDDLDAIVETLALGLSPQFRAEIAAARAAVGSRAD